MGFFNDCEVEEIFAIIIIILVIVWLFSCFNN